MKRTGFPSYRRRPQVWWSWLNVALALALSLMAVLPTSAQTDPPGRVGRIADLRGQVSWFDLAEGRWNEAVRNRPITAGDRVSTGRDAAVELRIGSTTVKLAEATEVELLRLDDEGVRVQLHRGSLALRLRSREVAAETEVGTDEAWFQPQRGGLYRLDREDDTTFALAWRGEMVAIDDSSVVVEPGRRAQLWREGPSRELRQRVGAPVDDAFAARVQREDRDDERSASAAHVSPEMTGFEDLDRHGRWDTHPDYGPVWAPLAVQPGWAPYRSGRWEWVGPWGWTWIDDAPWGFAPFHYGRWVSWRGRWCWVPGPYVRRPVFAPALVAWIDGPGFGIGLRPGGPTVSWVPLAPWEPFRPHYHASPGYHDRINAPDHRRWRPQPPRREPPTAFGNQGVPQAVTVLPRDRLRHPPPHRDGAEPPRPALRPPGTTQPLLPHDANRPGHPPRPDHAAPRPPAEREARERDLRDREARDREARERDARQAREQAEARLRDARNRVGPPQPTPLLAPPAAQPQPRPPSPSPPLAQPPQPPQPAVQGRPASPPEPRHPARERDKEPAREEGKGGKSGETRGQPR